MRLLKLIFILTITSTSLFGLSYLVITENGQYRGRINVTDWESGSRFLRFYNDVGVSFPYLWQGEDSIDYRIEDGVMWINEDPEGVDLYEIELTEIELDEICDRTKIKTLLVSGDYLDEVDRFPNLTAVSVTDMWPHGDGDTTEIDFSPVTRLENLRGLFFGAGDISATQMEAISKCSELRELDFEVCILAPGAMAKVRNLPNLRRLSVASIPDEEMVALSGHPRLQSITRYWMVFGTLWLDILPTLPSLTELTTIQCEIADPVLEYLAESNRLVSFSCPHAGIYGDKITYISRMTNLRVLDLTGTEVYDEDMHYLTKLVNLEHLDLNVIDLTEEGVTHISTLPNLRSLSLAPYNTDAALEHLESLHNLEQLYLTNSDITENGLRTLATFDNLKIINLSGTDISAEDIAILRQSLPDCAIVKRY